jgi:zinc transporter
LVGWPEISAWHPDQGTLWIHLDYTHPDAQRWLREDSGLGELSCEALLAEETRPRTVVYRDQLLAQLRGVNLNPGADADDMVSIRLWSDGKRVITTRRRKLLSVVDLRQALEAGEGPTTCGEFVTELADRLAVRMADAIDDIEDAVDTAEEQVLTAMSHQLRPLLASIRREAIMLRRYLAPQREALTRLHSERLSWLEELQRLQLREVADRTTRYVEDLDAARERAGVVQEELVSRLSEQMDRRMYVLSVVAALFLPLGFITGLLGVNVGGIPGSEDSHAFIAFSVGLLVLIAVQLLILKWRRWI